MASVAKRVKLEPTSPPQGPLPAPALGIVAAYLNPFQLLKMAQVNKTWYACFTSDSAWEHYDVYGVERGVCDHYLATKDTSERDEWECRFERVGSGLPYHNLYHVLAALRERFWELCQLIDLSRVPKSFFWAFIKAGQSDCPLFCAIRLSFENVNSRFHTDKELVYALLRWGIQILGLNPMYSHDRTAALCCKSIHAFDFDRQYFDFYALAYFSTELLNDPEVALHAVCLWYGAYKYIPLELRSDKKYFYAQYQSHLAHSVLGDPYVYAPAKLRGDRELALEVVEELPQAIGSLSAELQNDWELVRTAYYNAQPIALGCRMPPVSAAIMANEEYASELLKVDYVLPIDEFKPEMRIDESVLRLYLPKIAEIDERDVDEYLECILFRSLVALRPLKIDVDYDYIKRVLSLEHQPWMDDEDQSSDWINDSILRLLGPPPSWDAEQHQ